MAQDTGNLGLVTVWLRQDDAGPPVYSARFRIDGGRGWLKWPSSPSVGVPLAAPTGTAGGLYLEDVLGLKLRFKLGGGRTWREVTVFPSGVPTRVSKAPGRWVEISLSPDHDGDEPTDMAPAPTPIADEDPVTDTLPPRTVAVEEEGDDADILEPAATLPGAPTPSARGGSALVRSLVVRIRQQEAEIAALKKRIAELEAR